MPGVATWRDIDARIASGRNIPMRVSIEGLHEYVEQVVAAAVEQALGRALDDPWFDSKQAAEYLGVKVGTIHDLVSAGRLPRHGERKAKLRFRRSELDAHMEGRFTRSRGGA
jgi:excisionase family DNA binding protein